MKIINAVFDELGKETVQYLPSKEELMSTTKGNLLNWNPVVNFKNTQIRWILL